MAKLNYKTLGKAVTVYSPLHVAGKTEEEVKAAIAADAKGFDEDGVNEIYEAIINPEVDEDNDEEKSYKVANGKSFRDKTDFSIEYTEDSDISHLSQDRIDHLLSIGYVKEA